MITMFDSIDVSQLPRGPGLAYAGYVNGRWQTYPVLKSMFPGHSILPITVTATGVADCLDVEPGNATISEAAAWVAARLAAGAWRPVIYASVSQMGALISAVHAVSAGALSDIRLWTAHYTGAKHICGPRTCGELAVNADGTQWTDKSGGKNLDESVLLDGFFNGSGSEVVPAWEAEMMNALPVLQLGAKDSGLPWLVRRVQGLCVALGSEIAIDGDFGPATQTAVKWVQSTYHLTADGIVGPKTWAALVTGSA